MKENRIYVLMTLMGIASSYPFSQYMEYGKLWGYFYDSNWKLQCIFLDLAVTKSLQSTRMVTDDDDDAADT